MEVIECWVCDKPIDFDVDDWSDTDNGEAHDKCLDAWLDDARGRRADFYFDTAGDR